MDIAARLERSQWDFFWIPDDAVVHERPELLYVACPRDIGYLNQVTRTDPAHADLDGLVAEVGDAHQNVGSLWIVPERIATPRLQGALGRGGYRPAIEHDARAIATDGYTPRPAASCEVRRVTTVAQLRDLLTVVNAAMGRDRAPTEAELQAELQQCADPNGRIHRFVAYAQGRPVSCGGLNAYDDLQLGFLWAGSTVPDAEGHGYYSAVVAARVAWARARGLRWVGLYARTTTSSPIVERQGFERYGAMTFWQRPGLQHRQRKAPH